MGVGIVREGVVGPVVFGLADGGGCFVDEVALFGGEGASEHPFGGADRGKEQFSAVHDVGVGGVGGGGVGSAVPLGDQDGELISGQVLGGGGEERFVFVEVVRGAFRAASNEQCRLAEGQFTVGEFMLYQRGRR